MTEAEARTRWCPWASSRVIPADADGALVILRLPGEKITPMCIASECMSWRWSSPPFPNVQPSETGVAAGNGYCGLAGKP